MAPVEVVTDQAAARIRVLEQVFPEAWHRTEQYANNQIEADHAQWKRWLRLMMAASAASWPVGRLVDYNSGP